MPQKSHEDESLFLAGATLVKTEGQNGEVLTEELKAHGKDEGAMKCSSSTTVSLYRCAAAATR